MVRGNEYSGICPLSSCTYAAAKDGQVFNLVQRCVGTSNRLTVRLRYEPDMG
jgi:hypothetical protein